ncbi:rho GTPase-activating protein 20-like [Arvicanthis niloticus]|uniref:rho GTPase-activating protein 20-like n=1 Tax=Arvicanthis niloticus TaxID=61156 RepID=UPI00402B6C7B
MEDRGGMHRSLLCQGPALITSDKKKNKRHLSLFNDVLVVSSNLNKKKFKIKCIIPLNYLWVMDAVDLDENCSSKTLFLFWATGNFVVTFRSKEQKDQWYYFLKRSIKEAKNGIKTNFSLQIFTEDIPSCDSPLCVTATNISTVNDIIEKLRPMIRVTNIEDYQLWFCPGHEEAPRALQGYEYPHDIMMNNLQKNFSSLNSRIFTAFPPLPGLLVNDLYSDSQGQFILKPIDSARIQQPNAMERPDKKERPPRITSCFHRGSVPQQDQGCTVPRVNKSGKLFGKELSSICHAGKVPTAILDILSLINEKGPTTEGIFIISPNGTMCKTLKEKMDSGEEVDIKHQSVHVVAWILKEFLRSIKGTLLTPQFYDQWLAVTQMVTDEEKVTALQSLLEKLPQPNAALLRQVFRILHKIARNSSVNQMSPYHLSIAIAPYILCLPSYPSDVLDNDIAKKISLVMFMIENSPKIFGVDLVVVWYETSFLHPYEAKASCSPTPPSDDGNRKEMENELNSCPSAKICTPRHNSLMKSRSAPILYDGIVETDKQEGNVYTTQPAPSPAPIKEQELSEFPYIVCLKRMLPSPLLDMLSIIAEKGQDSDEIFSYVKEESHSSLRDRIYNEELINWNEESVLTIASVLREFIGNIKGSLIPSDLYEDWISVPDQESLLGKIAAIQSILLKMPQRNFLLLKRLIHVLVKIKTSSKNDLDTYILSLRIASKVLLDPKYKYLLYKSEHSKKFTIIQIMIDNYFEIFGNNENTISKENQKSSDELRMSLNTAAGDCGTISTYDIPQQKLLQD